MHYEYWIRNVERTDLNVRHTGGQTVPPDSEGDAVKTQ